MLKQIVVLNAGDLEHFISTFHEAAAARSLTTENIDTKDCLITIGHNEDNKAVSVIYNNLPLVTKDTGFVFRRTNQDTYRTYLIATILSKQAPAYIDNANLLSDKTADKMTIGVLLPLSGIQVPKSILLTNHSYKVNQQFLSTHLTFPSVIKKTGSKGKQVWKVNTLAELEEKLGTDDNLTLIQEYIENDYDLRVFVLDGKVIGAVRRSSADGFYNNLSQGGQGEKAEISEQERDICIKAAEIAQLRLAGVDLVRSPRGPLVFEVNKAPQMDIFNPFVGFDLEKTYSVAVLDDLMRDSK